MSDCCAPKDASDRAADGADRAGGGCHEGDHKDRPYGGDATKGMAAIPGGVFVMGADDEMSYPNDGERPVHQVNVSPYSIDTLTVTNEDFATFVEATKFQTDAERFEWSFVFAGLLPDDFPATRGAADSPWWRQVMGADWRHPEGPHSHIDDRLGHPVVHVSWSDAEAYAAWVGKSLPTEAQWERACRGERERARFPWGDELTPGGEHRMNVWQGTFPSHNTRDDGWYGTCPSDAYPANDWGMHNMTGNVWEWQLDWFDVFAHQTNPPVDPIGPPDGDLKVLKGGSFLCHESYCARYRPAARMGLPPDTSTSNAGFRCARPA